MFVEGWGVAISTDVYRVSLFIRSFVIKACALQADLEVVPQGDLTEVGEKGITVRRSSISHVAYMLALSLLCQLSGGQRARVSLG